MSDKQTLVNYFINLINDTPESNIQTRIDAGELQFWPRTHEHQFIRDNFDALFDLFIRKGNRRIVFATRQGNETFVGVLIYKVENDTVHEPTSVILHDHRLAEYVHNKRVKLSDTAVHNSVQSLIGFIERGETL